MRITSFHAALSLLLAGLPIVAPAAEAKVLASRNYQEYYVVDQRTDYLPFLKNPKNNRLVRSMTVDAPSTGDYLFTLSAICSSSIDLADPSNTARLAGAGVEVLVSTQFTSPVVQPASNAKADILCGNDGDKTPLSGLRLETLTIPIKLTKGRNILNLRVVQTLESKVTLFRRIAVTIND